MIIKLSIDASGGDFGFPVTVNAGLQALNLYKNLNINFVGDKASIEREIKKQKDYKLLLNRVAITHTNEVVEMNDSISNALRRKKNSSMRIAINLVKEKKVDACVSAGNTGALMAISNFVLKTIPGIDRPAIMGNIPTIKGNTHMLDMGANIDAKKEHLLQFATMGSVAVSYIKNISKPKVALLNVGIEDIKGNTNIQNTAALLKESDLNYIGFIEGDAIYTGDADVIVCDGFIGNISLKSSEGAAKMLTHLLKKSFNKNIINKMIYMISKNIIKEFKKRADPGQYNGASLLGLTGIVIKSHGGANINSYLQAIKIAYIEANNNLIEKISQQLTKQLK